MKVPKLGENEVLLKNGQIWKCHPKSVCASNVTPCVFHSPTNHVMSLLPLQTRYDKAFRYDPDNPDESFPESGILLLMLERQCEHGVGHPDPDCVALRQLLSSLVSIGVYMGVVLTGAVSILNQGQQDRRAQHENCIS